ncbi:hypothetical protein [Spirillospora albida]|uniref:hypothetical protein n=1 Tax=Spirillospora albida TaxID=58123 RepID=UPI0004C16420|nr:hypothetical protein [Spirillospora albida]
MAREIYIGAAHPTVVTLQHRVAVLEHQVAELTAALHELAAALEVPGRGAPYLAAVEDPVAAVSSTG